MESNESSFLFGDVIIYNRTPEKRKSTETVRTEEGESSCQTSSTTPQKKLKLDSLRLSFESTMSDIELYTTSAAYYFNKNDMKEGINKLEKSKRLVHSHVQKGLFLLKEVQQEVFADRRTITKLQHNESALQTQIIALQKDKKILQKQVDQLKGEVSFLNEDFLDEGSPSQSKDVSQERKD